MQEYRAAAVGDARRTVVIDLDNKIVEIVVAFEPVAAAISVAPHRLVVVAAAGIFAPGVLRSNGANRQKCPRPRVAVGAPPQLPGPERAFWGPAVALALVRPYSAAPERHRYRSPVSRQPAPAGIAGGGVNPDRGKRPITQGCLISD